MKLTKQQRKELIKYLKEDDPLLENAWYMIHQIMEKRLKKLDPELYNEIFGLVEKYVYNNKGKKNEN